MVDEIRIYVEGGGDSKDTKAFLRQGFSQFLADPVSSAREKGIRWQIVMCGTRGAAVDAFRTSVRQRPGVFHILLIDSEGPVAARPWNHLRGRGEWYGEELDDQHCHLMVQCMEAWFVADVDALQAFYGPQFNPNPIPRNPDVELIAKARLTACLKAATRATQKGEYQKIHHAYQILQRINVNTVRHASRHCDRLFVVLETQMH